MTHLVGGGGVFVVVMVALWILMRNFCRQPDYDLDLSLTILTSNSCSSIFSASGIYFIFIYIEYSQPLSCLVWTLLQQQKLCFSYCVYVASLWQTDLYQQYGLWSTIHQTVVTCLLSPASTLGHGAAARNNVMYTSKIYNQVFFLLSFLPKNFFKMFLYPLWFVWWRHADMFCCWDTMHGNWPSQARTMKWD